MHGFIRARGGENAIFFHRASKSMMCVIDFVSTSLCRMEPLIQSEALKESQADKIEINIFKLSRIKKIAKIFLITGTGSLWVNLAPKGAVK